jgi:hypothetical protein
VAVGTTEPLVTPAYDPLKRAANSRVEIIVDESLMQEFQGDGKTETPAPMAPAAATEGV